MQLDKAVSVDIHGQQAKPHAEALFLFHITPICHVIYMEFHYCPTAPLLGLLTPQKKTCLKLQYFTFDSRLGPLKYSFDPRGLRNIILVNIIDNFSLIYWFDFFFFIPTIIICSIIVSGLEKKEVLDRFLWKQTLTPIISYFNLSITFSTFD